MSSRIFLLILLFCSSSSSSSCINLVSCRTQTNNNVNNTNKTSCVHSTCGNIHEIRYPFRLPGDPTPCGDPDPIFLLQCQRNHTILTLNSRPFYIQSIDYTNFMIRLVDPSLSNPNATCTSLPTNFTGYDEIPSTTFTDFLELNNPVIFINCLSKPNSSRYIETRFCGEKYNQSLHSYVAVGEGMDVSDVEESCGVEMVAWASNLGPVIGSSGSLWRIREGLAYGFELSWYRVFCGECLASHGFCSLEGNTVSCKRYCYEDVPVSQLGFRCQVEYYSVFVFAYGIIAIVGIVGLRLLCGVPLLIALIVYKWRRRHLSMDQTIEDFLESQNSLTPIHYSYSEVKKMTNGFREKLGEGGYGTIYKGKLRSGLLVAVKMMNMSKSMANEQEFMNEVAIIGRIHHTNVVQLVGFCLEGSKRALVYEFMPNGSLERHISSGSSYTRLFRISLGVARGIDYLHRGGDMQILHFDIKPHNILLDQDFNPKISDFGLAKLYPTDHSVVSLTAARGTMGYMAPELFYENIGGVSYKADVYSFGMLLMEIVVKRGSIINPITEKRLRQIFFPSWVYDHLSEGNNLQILDATEEDERMVKKMIVVALWCIQMKPADRPPMSRVVEMLDGDDRDLPMPQKPFVAPREIDKDRLNL